jgi:hypothetical protein
MIALTHIMESADDRRRRKLAELQRALDEASEDGLGLVVAVIVTAVVAVVGFIVAVAKVLR